MRHPASARPVQQRYDISWLADELALDAAGKGTIVAVAEPMAAAPMVAGAATSADGAAGPAAVACRSPVANTRVTGHGASGER